jgi:peroxiredoxin
MEEFEKTLAYLRGSDPSPERKRGAVQRALVIGAMVGLAAFTVWLTWLAKGLESQQSNGTQARLLMQQPAPELPLKSLDGRPVGRSVFKGKKNVVLSFWSSSSRPCRMELAALRSLYKRQDELGFAILTVSVDADVNAAGQYAKEQQLPFPVLLDPSRQAAHAYGVQVVPSLFLIDKRGIVVRSTAGATPMLESSVPSSFQMNEKFPGRGGSPFDAGRN